MNIVQSPAPPLSPELVARFPQNRRRQIRGDRPGRHRALRHRRARPVSAGRSPLVLRPWLDGGSRRTSASSPTSTQSRWCRRAANTGLVGGQTPHNGEVVVSMRRLDKIRDIDTASNTMTCEAGVVLQIAQQRASEVDRLFPLSLGAEGSLHHRRQPLHQCRRHPRRWPMAWRARWRSAGSGAGRRARSERAVEAEEGQYRLRSEQPLHQAPKARSAYYSGEP